MVTEADRREHLEALRLKCEEQHSRIGKLSDECDKRTERIGQLSEAGAKIRAAALALASLYFSEHEHELQACVFCEGRRWVTDENAHAIPATEREPYHGLLACGDCNHGGTAGLDEPDQERAEVQRAFAAFQREFRDAGAYFPTYYPATVIANANPALVARLRASR